MAGITSQALQSGSKRRECTEVRKELSRHFVLELGLSYADTARVLGISFHFAIILILISNPNQL